MIPQMTQLKQLANEEPGPKLISDTQHSILRIRTLHSRFPIQIHGAEYRVLSNRHKLGACTVAMNIKACGNRARKSRVYIA